jgi:hypothetical protein
MYIYKISDYSNTIIEEKITGNNVIARIQIKIF